MSSKTEMLFMSNALCVKCSLCQMLPVSNAVCVNICAFYNINVLCIAMPLGEMHCLSLYLDNAVYGDGISWPEREASTTGKKLAHSTSTFTCYSPGSPVGSGCLRERANVFISCGHLLFLVACKWVLFHPFLVQWRSQAGAHWGTGPSD